jgi:hypothetical protein
VGGGAAAAVCLRGVCHVKHLPRMQYKARHVSVLLFHYPRGLPSRWAFSVTSVRHGTRHAWSAQVYLISDAKEYLAVTGTSSLGIRTYRWMVGLQLVCAAGSLLRRMTCRACSSDHEGP